MSLRCVSVLLCTFGGLHSLDAQPLSPAEERGRELFRTGISSAGRPASARLGAGSSDIPASQVPCASCHGPDGRGRPEGGVEPSDIRWGTLTAAREAEHPNGRRHPRYTERSFLRAVTMGLDPAGNRLSYVMPRYRFFREDMEDLVSYLKRIEDLPAPGVTAGSIGIGVILPPATMLERRDATRAAVSAYFEGVNRGGGIFSRRIVPRFLELPSSSEAAVDLFREAEPFALVASFIAGAEDRIGRVLKDRQLPLIGALSPNRDTSGSNPYVFYLDSGVPGECDALADHAEARYAAKGRRMAFVYSEEGLSNEMATRLKQRFWRLGWPRPLEFVIRPGAPDHEELARSLVQSRVEMVFYLTPMGNAAETVKAVHNAGASPEFLFPASFVSTEMWSAPRLGGAAVVAFSAFPHGPSPAGAAEYSALAKEFHLPAVHVMAQWRAIAAAKLLTRALSLVGRDVSRGKLMNAMESMYEVETGLIPPVTFGPNQRVGLRSRIVILNEEAGSRTGGR